MIRPLSPAAQAVLDAVADVEWSIDFTDLAATVADTQRAIAAAALRAAASHLREAYAKEEYVDSADDWLDVLAAELEAQR